MYKAKIIKVMNLSPHPNADKLQLLDYGGMQFVVGTDTKIGDVVILFPVDGKLSPEMLRQNNLYRDSIKNIDPLKSGFFEDNGKIKSIKLRGEISQGFIAGINSISWAIGKTVLDIGTEFDTLNGNVICEKYFTPATLKRMNGNKRTKKSSDIERSIHKHYDVENLAYNLDKLPNSGFVIITSKIHGSSGVSGYVKCERKVYPWYNKLVNNIFKKQIIAPTIKTTYEYVSLTRNTVVNDREDCTNPEGSDYYRWMIHNTFFDGVLRKGETVYYELAGFTHTGQPIMQPQFTDKLNDKNIEKTFGKKIVYSYGCDPSVMGKQFAVYVYRITQQNEDGDVIELHWHQIEQRCNELGLNIVPVLTKFYCHDKLAHDVWEYCKDIVENPACSALDTRHLREGAVVRIETEKGVKVYKAKSRIFLVLEGVAKENVDYVDQEEIN